MWIKYDDSSYSTVLINTDHISLIEYNSNYIMITMMTGQSYTTKFGSSAYQKLYKFISKLDKQQSYTALLLFFVRYRIFCSIRYYRYGKYICYLYGGGGGGYF